MRKRGKQRGGGEKVENVAREGRDGCIRKKSMDKEQKEKTIEGWKINLYQKHRIPFPPPTHTIVNK